MPIITNYTLSRSEDAIITFYLVPAQPVGGWGVTYSIMTHYEAPSMWTASIVSGLANGASGLTVLNSGLGWFRVAFFGSGVSGLGCGSYATRLQRVDSGNVTTLQEGFLQINP